MRLRFLAALIPVACMAATGCEITTEPVGPVEVESGIPITEVTVVATLQGPDSVFAGERPTMTWSVSGSAKQGSVTLAPTFGVQALVAQSNLVAQLRFPVFFVQEPGSSSASGTFEAPVSALAGDSIVVTLVVSATFEGDGESEGIERWVTTRVRGVAPPDSTGGAARPDAGAS